MRRPFGWFLILLALPLAALVPLPAAAQVVPQPTDFLIARVPETGLRPAIAPWPGGALLAAYPGGSWDFSSCARGFAPCSGLPLVGTLLQSLSPPDALFLIGESLPEPRLFLSPTLLPDAEGGFAAVWEDAVYLNVRLGTFWGGDGAGSGIAARIFTAPGVPAGPVFHLNQTVAGDQTAPAATPLPDGRFLVVWESRVRFDSPPRLLARIFQTDGTPAGDEFAVAPELPGAQQAAAAGVPISPDGGFVIAWQGEAGGRTVIFTRRFRGLADVLDAPVRVDGATDHGAAAPALATLPDGLALAWRGERAQSGRAFVRVRRLDESGAPDGPMLQAHPFPLPLSGIVGRPHPDVAADREGGFLVVWNGPRFPGSARTAVFATAFDAAGATPFFNRRIDLRRQQNPINPVVVFDGERTYVVAWQVDQSPPPLAAGVQRGRRLVIPEKP
jgi:hypothetical protein